MNVSLSPSAKPAKEPSIGQGDREIASLSNSEKHQFQGVFNEAIEAQSSEKKAKQPGHLAEATTGGSKPSAELNADTTHSQQSTSLLESSESEQENSLVLPSAPVSEGGGEEDEADSVLTEVNTASKSTSSVAFEGKVIAGTQALSTAPVHRTADEKTKTAAQSDEVVGAETEAQYSQVSPFLDRHAAKSDSVDNDAQHVIQTVNEAKQPEGFVNDTAGTQAQKDAPKDAQTIEVETNFQASSGARLSQETHSQPIVETSKPLDSSALTSVPIDEQVKMQAEQTMSDGQTLLQRLNQYHQALFDKSGKDLPLTQNGDDIVSQMPSLRTTHEEGPISTPSLAFVEPMTKLNAEIPNGEDGIDWSDSLSDEVALAAQWHAPTDEPTGDLDSKAVTETLRSSSPNQPLNHDDQLALELTHLLMQSASDKTEIPREQADAALDKVAQSLAQGQAVSPTQQQLLQALVHSPLVQPDQVAVAEQLLSQTLMAQTDVRPSVMGAVSADELPVPVSTSPSPLSQVKSAPSVPQVGGDLGVDKGESAPMSNEKMLNEFIAQRAAVNSQGTDNDRTVLKRQRTQMMNELSSVTGAEHKSAAGTVSAGYSSSNQGLSATPTSSMAPMRTDFTAMNMTRELAHDQLNEKVQMMMAKNLKSLDIRLDPPELGRLHIRMNLHSDGANVHFTVATPQARDMIEHTMPRLRDMLSSQGVSLGETSVQQEARQQSNSGGLAQGGQGSHNEQGAEMGALNEDESVVNVTLPTSANGVSFYA
ncbi:MULTISPECIES: flagellar hook-length control protein FliK [unclassified Vibrio]|uniref:Flagellar hook-length control protein FliK n=1 Tax=Vibrio sp. HB236076 TaxID=3232307 RepID=A0AB39HDB3_9VIBR|nr:flagellar hook-length control protein FliK [Vibrio sp. HB161653]MDP5254795.1 flagellar hook-length control protein FliK [Vibrio sp. HB161653]